MPHLNCPPDTVPYEFPRATRKLKFKNQKLKIKMTNQNLKICILHFDICILHFEKRAPRGSHMVRH